MGVLVVYGAEFFTPPGVQILPPGGVRHAGFPPGLGSLDRPGPWISLGVTLVWFGLTFEGMTWGLLGEGFVFGVGLAYLMDRILGVLKFLFTRVKPPTGSFFLGVVPAGDPLGWWFLVFLVLFFLSSTSGGYSLAGGNISREALKKVTPHVETVATAVEPYLQQTLTVVKPVARWALENPGPAFFGATTTGVGGYFYHRLGSLKAQQLSKLSDQTTTQLTESVEKLTSEVKELTQNVNLLTEVVKHQNDQIQNLQKTTSEVKAGVDLAEVLAFLPEGWPRGCVLLVFGLILFKGMEKSNHPGRPKL